MVSVKEVLWLHFKEFAKYYLRIAKFYKEVAV